MNIYSDILILGVAVRLEAGETWRLERALACCRTIAKPGEIAACPAVKISVRLGDTDAADHHHLAGAQLSIARGAIEIQADGARGLGEIRCNPSALDGDLFEEMMVTLALFLVAQHGRVPLHASAVMLGQTALVLAGRSGMGKSSLALAANRKGLAVLSDDTVYVQTQPLFRLWALPRAIHVFEKDAPSSSEGGMRFRAGRWKRALPIARPRESAARAILCLLSRGEAVSLAPLDAPEAVAELNSDIEPGYDGYGARRAQAAQAVAAGGCWRLTLSQDPAEALDRIAEIFSPSQLGRSDDGYRARGA